MSSADGAAKKSRTDEDGFHKVANILDRSFYDLLQFKPPPDNSHGNLLTAHKQLKTSFTASLKGVPKTPKKQTPPSTGAVTPSTAGSLPTRSSSRRSSLPSVSSLETPVTARSEGSGVSIQSLRFDDVSAVPSSTNQGMRRMRILDVLRLMPGDEFTLVIPPTDRKQPKPAIEPRPTNYLCYV